MACVSYCVFFLTFLLISISVWLTVANSLAARTEKFNNLEIEGELVFVHVLIRHGDRNPMHATPGSKYNDISYWPEGWEQLTNLGVQQQFSLGQWLRRRYSNYLSSVYNVNDIYVQSSDVDRTLMSAQSALAGLYPPFGNKIWNRNLPWQPIPVHTINLTMDYLIGGKVPKCLSYENAKEQYGASNEAKNFKVSIKPIYNYLMTHTGSKINSLYTLFLIRDSWYCASVHNYTIPLWVNKLYPDNLDFERAVMKLYYYFAGTKFMAKFMSGFLLKDILDRFSSKIENSLSPNRKLWMYSTHDTTLFSLLHSLDISDNNFVPYAAAITLELRKYQNEYYVQIFYKKSARNPEPIIIPGCGTACPLSKMYKIYDDIIPKHDFNTECLIPENKQKTIQK